MDYKSFFIKGCGTTQEKAALEFMNEFHRQFPKKKGMYDLMIRQFLTYDVETDFASGQKNHMYRIRGTWGLVAELEAPEAVNLKVDTYEDQQEALNVCTEMMMIALSHSRNDNGLRIICRPKPIVVLSAITSLFEKLKEDELAGK